MKFSLLLFSFLFLLGQSSQAGIFEISALYNYKKTNYAPDTYEESESGTGSIAYYFWGLSGLELSFTRGASILAQPQYLIYQDITAYGLNFLFTIATKESSFKPFIKAGGSYVIKSLRNYYTGFVGVPPPPAPIMGPAPSIGVGFKYAIGPQFEFKAGVDAETSPLDNSNSNPVTYDFSLNAGLGFLF